MPSRPLLILILALVAAALAAVPAQAASNLEVGIADDRAFLEEPDPARATALAEQWRDMGIESVRLLAKWYAVAPAAAATRPPAGFDATNHASPGYDWAELDRAIEILRGVGIRPILAVTGPGPLWGTSEPALRDQRLNPRPDLFAQFARAVAVRYGSRVGRYAIWNEPNLPLWLKHQFDCVGRRCSPRSPHLYRRLFSAAYSAIHAADREAVVLAGALAPRGVAPDSRNDAMRPLTFLRALGCVDARLRRVRTGRCSGFRPIRADGIAYHPHGVTRAPDERNPQVDEASLGDLDRLEAQLRGIQRANGLRNARGATRPFDLWFTEYGYQTRPPDLGRDGVSTARQAAWLQQAAFLSWRNPRVRGLVQYEWYDEPVRAVGASRYAGWQSGLRFLDGRAKPALRGFRLPFWVDLQGDGRTARLWGQVRPGGAQSVSVQRRSVGSTAWSPLRRVTTDSRGFFTFTQVLSRPLEYRFAWDPAGEPLQFSDVRRVRPTR